MVRKGLSSLVLVVAACSIPNPWFELDDDDTRGTSTVEASSSDGPASETGTPTGGPDTDPGPTSDSGTGVCGDAVVDPGETCDDGNTDDNDDCPANCVSLACGNGVVDAMDEEECDDGNVVYMVRIGPCCSNSIFYVS